MSADSKAQIFERIAPILADCMALNLEVITRDSRLFDDLNLDSLDFLDVIFSLESEFDIELRDAELDKFMRGELIDPESLDNGLLSPGDIERLAAFLPALGALTEPIAPREVASFLTVETLVIVVQRRLSGQPIA